MRDRPNNGREKQGFESLRAHRKFETRSLYGIAGFLFWIRQSRTNELCCDASGPLAGHQDRPRKLVDFQDFTKTGRSPRTRCIVRTFSFLPNIQQVGY